MKCMQLNPLPAELLMYHIHQELINRDTSITLIMASIIRMSLLNCAPPADRAPSVPRKPHIHLVPRLESLLSGFSCPCVWFGEQQLGLGRSGDSRSGGTGPVTFCSVGFLMLNRVSSPYCSSSLPSLVPVQLHRNKVQPRYQDVSKHKFGQSE